MYSTMLFILLTLFSFLYIFANKWFKRSGSSARLPPGPYPIPIIGSMFKLGNKPHHSLAALSETYGPLMSLKIGSITTIVVSSREIVQEVFSKHDMSFSSRTVPYGVNCYTQNLTKNSVIWLPVGDKWRIMRKVLKEQLFSIRQLDASKELRKKKVQELLNYVQDCCTNRKAVNINHTAATATLNVLSNYIFSADIAHYDSTSTEMPFRDIILEIMKLGGTPNLADFFPIFRHLDPNGLVKKLTPLYQKLMAIFEIHINNKLEERAKRSADAPSSTNDLTDLLLGNIQNEIPSISLDDMPILLSDLFIAGSDATSNTLEWAMAELIRNPEKMLKAKSELKELMGTQDGPIEESYISRLPYLQAVVKETLRLHPPVTFLVPHRTISDVKVQGYMIPKDAKVLCNVWAMGQDSNVWPNPQMFEPERFLDVNVDYQGQDFELIPFGTGRRMCPGLPLAHRMLHLMLGSLIHKFDWKIEGGMRPQDMDMTDTFGFTFTLQKNEPLLAMPVKI
ncbi:cytochrome P450 [Artemisia annua]|uniref:Cytochrome P450 n=1 Tax=Artemisia annua TaxID=35608 RepID=A0A2U1N2K9_ARTAN|nr:cytochrome P450 [Artemisia annua]